MKNITVFLFLLSPMWLFAQTAQDYYELAVQEFNEGKNEKALSAINQAITLTDTIDDYYIIKLSIIALNDKNGESWIFLQDALAKFPGSLELLTIRAEVRLLAKLSKNAIADYTKIIDIADQDSVKLYAYYKRAMARIDVREFRDAYDDLMICYQSDSNSTPTLNGLGMVCDELGKKQTALKYYQRIIDLDPTAYYGYGNMGFILQNRGEHELAIGYLNKALEIDPQMAFGYSNRSFSKMHLGDLNGAMKDINKSIKLDSENSYAFRNRALIYLKMEKTDKACLDLQTALDKGFKVMYGEEVSELIKKHCNN